MSGETITFSVSDVHFFSQSVSQSVFFCGVFLAVPPKMADSPTLAAGGLFHPAILGPW
jgi:hypothetical protein